MNILNRNEIRELVEFAGKPAVSLFLPTHPGSAQRQQDEIRLKNLVSHAAKALVERGSTSKDAEQFMRRAAELQKKEEFWSRRADGLACFLADDSFRAYRVPLKLAEQWFVNDRFHIKPLLPLLRADSRFYILTLSQMHARLFEATRYSIREMDLPDIPRTPVDGAEQAHQYHAHRAPSQGKGQTEEAMFHGQGGPEDRKKSDILQFFHRVDRAVTSLLGEQRAPLVAACVGYLGPIYESTSGYKNLLKENVAGDPDRWSQEELREQAWRIAEPELLKGQQQALAEFEKQRGSSRASDNIRDCILAAEAGRVDALFVEEGAKQWGRVEPALQAVHLSQDENSSEEELLDYAVCHTLANSGEVYVLETIPQTDSPLAARFRY